MSTVDLSILKGSGMEQYMGRSWALWHAMGLGETLEDALCGNGDAITACVRSIKNSRL